MATFSPDLEQMETTEKHEVPSSIRNSLLSLMKKFGQREQYPRLCELSDAQAQRFYYRGYQHIYWNTQMRSFMVFGNGGINMPYDSNAAEQPTFMYNFNLYRAYAESFMAVMTQNQPTTRELPDDVMNPLDVSTAHNAEKLKKLISARTNSKNLRVEISRFMWTDRRVIVHTTFDEKEEKACSQAYGVLETKVPIATSSKRQWPYCFISVEKDLCQIKEENPDQADQIKSGTTGAPMEQVARSMRMSCMEGTPMYVQSGDNLAYMGTETMCWFQPSAYRELSDADADELRQAYPEGVHCKFCGDVLLGEPKSEDLCDAIDVMVSRAGDGMSTVSVGSSLMPIQDVVNDMMNMTVECYGYTIPCTWLRDNLIDIDALQTQKAAYGAHQVVDNAPTGTPMEDNFYTEPSIEPPAQMFQFMEYLGGTFSQFLTAQQPAIFGGKMGGAGETAKGYQQAAQQALGVMGLAWAPFTVLWANITKHQLMATINNPPEQGQFTGAIENDNGFGEDELVTLSAQDLKGEFHCHPEADMDFPESFSQKKATFQQLMLAAETNPVIAKTMMEPDNMVLAKEYSGLEDLVVPGADSRNKQLKEISEMLKVSPVMDLEKTQANQQQADQTVMQLGGQPGHPVPQVMKSSVDIAPYDDNVIEAEECKRWLNSPEGQRAKEEQPDGFQNVVLHWQAHVAAVSSQMPAAPPPIMPPKAPVPPNKTQNAAPPIQ